MNSSRRKFIQSAAASGLIAPWHPGPLDALLPASVPPQVPPYVPSSAPETSIIGHYGPWAASLPPNPPTLSFRQPTYAQVDAWRPSARAIAQECLAQPDVGPAPSVTRHREYAYDGLTVQELSWQLPYGRPTQAILLKPAGVSGPLPAVLGLHDHGGDKYFGRRKITRTGEQHPLMVAHQEKYYRLRTAYLGGLDPRIACAVCVGFMTTWNDFLLNRAYTHTWMTYVPRLPTYLDFPEILGLRVPLPTLVLNNREDQLFTLPEMQRADAILQEVFAKADAAERYAGNFYPGLHKFDAEMQADAFAWFSRWLT